MIYLDYTKKITSVLVSLLSMICTGLALQAPPAEAKDCPNISGPFKRSTDNLIIDWSQNGCNISADSPSSGFDHRITGLWRGDRFDTRVLRRNISDGCTTTMYGKLYVMNNSQLTAEVYGTDGRCDLPTTYTETSIWKRI